MVHCISSSEPDSADLNIQSCDDWPRATSIATSQKSDLTDVTSGDVHYSNKKTHNPTHIAYAESSTVVSGLHFMNEQMKSAEGFVSSHNFDKVIHTRKSSDALLVMESQHMHSSLFDEEEGRFKSFLSNFFWYAYCFLLLHSSFLFFTFFVYTYLICYNHFSFVLFH